MKRCYKFTVILFLFLFNGCGIPDASSFETLLAPVIIDDKIEYPKCLYKNNQIIVQIKVMIYNTEKTFSGYNIYLTTVFSGLDDLKTSLTEAVESHTISYTSSREFNATIEDSFIIKNKTSLPTVPIGNSSINGYNKEPTIAILTINQTPQRQNLVSEAPYGLTVTAVSLSNIRESILGNVVWADTSGIGAKTPPEGVYCGVTG